MPPIGKAHTTLSTVDTMDQLVVTTVRMLAADAVLLWSRFLGHSPADPGVAGPRPVRPFRRARLDAAPHAGARFRLPPVTGQPA